jgi:hypothetical protein
MDKCDNIYIHKEKAVRTSKPFAQIACIDKNS